MIKLFFLKAKLLFNKIIKTDLYVKKYQNTVLTPVMPEYAYINWGKYLAMQGNLKGAMEKFQTSVSMARQIPEAYINLGLVYANLREFDMAEKNFKKAIKLDKSSAKAYALLASILMEKNSVEEAQYLYQKASKLDPRDSDIYLNWAVSLLRLKKAKESFEKFKMALLYNPANYMASHMWGVALLENGMYDEAIFQFNYTLSYTPNDFASLYYLACCFLKKKLYKEAIEQAQKSLLFNPENIDTYLLLSELYLKTNNEKKCLKYFEDAEKIGLKSLKLTLSEAIACKQFKRFDKAKEKFLQVLKQDPQNQTAMYNLAACELYLGNEDRGYELLQKVVEINPKNPEALYNIGIYHLKHNDYDEALVFFNKVLEISHTAVKNVYYDIANCYAAKSDFEKAIKFYNKNIEYYPKDIPSYLNLATVYIETQDLINAQRAVRAAFKIDKDSVSVNYTGAIVYLKSKLYKEALEKFDYVSKHEKEDKTVFFGRLECLIGLNRPKEVISILDRINQDENNAEIKLFYVKAYTRLACIEPSYYNIEEARKQIDEYKKICPDFNDVDVELQELLKSKADTGE